MEFLVQDRGQTHEFQTPKRFINAFDDMTLADRRSGGSPAPMFFGEKEDFGYGAQPMFSWHLGGDDSSTQFDSDWCLPGTFQAGLSLDDLADEFLQSNSFPKNGTDGDSLVKELPKSRTQEKIAEADEELPFLKEPSSLGQLLCRNQRTGKNSTVVAIPSALPRCPSRIKPFDFKSPSPDDIVRESQKGQKRGIRK